MDNNMQNRVITIIGYDLSSNKIIGLCEGKKCEVMIKPEKEASYDQHLLRSPERHAKRTWFGHKIDNRMEKALPVGSNVVAEQAIVINGNVLKIEASYIIHNALEHNIKNNFALPNNVEQRIMSLKSPEEDGCYGLKHKV